MKVGNIPIFNQIYKVLSLIPANIDLFLSTHLELFVNNENIDQQ